ncbi:hypothetical protein F2Q70_00043161 [Brassica cretica]|uniref:DUF1985 domain-containing protein n=1 Tax=Brassica cretica TaxID=69181 RepID=A0A8S9KL54_BRACR|nr:hypothetical protein F2Q70_00043161 [Brassica cretica]
MIPLATISENPNFQFSTNSPPIFQFFTLSFHFRLRNTAVLRLPYQSAAVNLLSFQFKSCKNFNPKTQFQPRNSISPSRNNQLDHRLPPRLFTTDRFPSGRLNIYSKPDLLAFIRHVLRDTLEFQFIRSSCFGKLFDLPTCQCPVSCKLTHAMLTRHLVCEDKHTFWSIFGSDPIKFGLQEFGTITGLPYGAFPVGYTTDKEDQSKAYKDPFWIKLIGKKRFTTIADLRRKLETHTCRGVRRYS